MKKINIFRIVGLLLIVCLFGVQTYAASGYVPCVAASLTKDNKTATSAYKMLDASYMYCETYSSSKYKVTYQAKASNNGKTWQTKKEVAYNPEKYGSVSLKNYTYNYWKITLTGNTTKSKKSKCIAFGKISE